MSLYQKLNCATISYMTTSLINITGYPNLKPFTVCQIQEDHNLYCGLHVQLLNIHIYKTKPYFSEYALRFKL